MHKEMYIDPCMWTYAQRNAHRLMHDVCTVESRVYIVSCAHMQQYTQKEFQLIDILDIFIRALVHRNRFLVENNPTGNLW